MRRRASEQQQQQQQQQQVLQVLQLLQVQSCSRQRWAVDCKACAAPAAIHWPIAAVCQAKSLCLQQSAALILAAVCSIAQHSTPQHSEHGVLHIHVCSEWLHVGAS
jgi:hypothetical protein